jgi:hypothetical protein
MVQIGDTLTPGWKTAKYLGDTLATGETMQVESIGRDWIVLRDFSGAPWSASFESKKRFERFIREFDK